MSGIVRCELICLYKHAKICFEILKLLMQIDASVQTCPDLP